MTPLNRYRKNKVIREKHLFQLFGTTVLYAKQHQNSGIQAVFCTTTGLSEEAKAVADALRINIRVKPHSPDYPMIKCNVNPGTGEKIYHLPCDQQYDRVVIGNQPGEMYARTAQEAEDAGFRRALRYRGKPRVEAPS